MKKTLKRLWKLSITISIIIDHICEAMYNWHQSYLEWLDKYTIHDRLMAIFDGEYDESYDNDVISRLYEQKKQRDNRIFCMQYGWLGIRSNG